jgi:hypothetical protein
VGKISKSKAQLHPVVDLSIATEVKNRAKALGLTPGKFAALVFEEWQAREYPPVSEADRLMQIAKGETSAHLLAAESASRYPTRPAAKVSTS